MNKIKLVFCIIAVFILNLACATIPEDLANVHVSMLDMLKVLEMGNVTLHGESEVTDSRQAPCSGNTQDVELELGTPLEDGSIRVKLTVILPYIWDGDCKQAEGESYYDGYGVFIPAAGTITFDGCSGEKGEGTATVLAIQGNDISEVGFVGGATCSTEDESNYKLDFRVRIDVDTHP